MPWSVTRSEDCPASRPWAVVRDSDGTVEGCHTTEAAANQQRAALYANDSKTTDTDRKGGQVQHKGFDIVETATGEEPGTFTATVAVFGNIDYDGDRIVHGAFSKSLAKWQASGDPIPVILSHQHHDPMAHIGIINPSDVRETRKGLVVKGKLDVEDNEVARQTHKLLKRRSLKEFSFGFLVGPGGTRKAKDGARELTELDVFEVGPTLKGANPSTELHAVKSALAEVEQQPAHQLTADELRARLDQLEVEVTTADVPEAPEVPDEPKPEPQAPAPTPPTAEELAQRAHAIEEAERTEREAAVVEPADAETPPAAELQDPPPEPTPPAPTPPDAAEQSRRAREQERQQAVEAIAEADAEVPQQVEEPPPEPQKALTPAQAREELERREQAERERLAAEPPDLEALKKWVAYFELKHVQEVAAETPAPPPEPTPTPPPEPEVPSTDMLRQWADHVEAKAMAEMEVKAEPEVVVQVKTEPIAGLLPEWELAAANNGELKAVWTTAYIDDLPDSAFLYVEAGGTKDSGGKTTPRSLRHLPYRDASGTVDVPHLRNALSRIPQSNLQKDVKDRLAAKAQGLLERQKSADVTDKGARTPHAVDPLRKQADAVALEFALDGLELVKSPQVTSTTPSRPELPLKDLRERCRAEMLTLLSGEEDVA